MPKQLGMVVHTCTKCGVARVRSFGDLCPACLGEDCQRTTKFSVDAKQLTEHLQEQQRLSDIHIERARKENEASLAQHKAANDEYKAWLVQYEAERIQAAHIREDARRDEAEKRAEERMRNDQLHRIYVMLLAEENILDGALTPLGLDSVIRRAREYQTFFEKETSQ